MLFQINFMLLQVTVGMSSADLCPQGYAETLAPSFPQNLYHKTKQLVMLGTELVDQSQEQI